MADRRWGSRPPRDNMYRSEDHRAGITGQSRQSDRTYDPNRYRTQEARHARGFDNEAESRFRDWSREYDTRGSARGRNHQDYGYGSYGTQSGFISGAEYGGYGRGSDYGSFDRGDDLTYGSSFGRGSDESGRLLRNAERNTRDYRPSTPHLDADFARGGTFDNDRDVDYSGRGPKGYMRSDETVHDRVCHALSEDGDVDASDIEVDVKDGIVTLKGTVADRYQKRTAEGTVEWLAGVRDVRNELYVRQHDRGEHLEQKQSSRK